MGCMVPVGPYLTVRGGCYQQSGTTYIFRLDVIINGAAEASKQVRPRLTDSSKLSPVDPAAVVHSHDADHTDIPSFDRWY